MSATGITTDKKKRKTMPRRKKATPNGATIHSADKNAASDGSSLSDKQKLTDNDKLPVAGSFHFAQQSSLEGMWAGYTEDEEASRWQRLEEQAASHKPEPMLLRVTEKELTAAADGSPASKYTPRAGRHLYKNPMQDLDYRVYESLMRHTFIGALAEALVRFIMGKGMEPELELINPDKEDEEINRNLIADNQEIITRLKQVDQYIDKHAGAGDASLEQKFASLIMSTLMYNRGALIFHYSKDYRDADGKRVPPIEIGGPDPMEAKLEKAKEEQEAKQKEEKEMDDAAEGIPPPGTSKDKDKDDKDKDDDAEEGDSEQDEDDEEEEDIDLDISSDDTKKPKKYPKIPVAVTFAHARDLGMCEIDDRTRNLMQVQYRYSWPYEGVIIPTTDMIYTWNIMSGSKVHNTWYYGTSILTPLIGVSKLIRQLISEDFPAMAKVAWASVFFIVAKNEGGTAASKRREWQAIMESIEPGKPGVIIKDPEQLEVHTVDWQARTQDFIALLDSMTSMAISTVGLPQVGFHDEAAANYATMVGKIKLTTQTTIAPMRKWLGDMISQQWYMRWFKMIYADNQEVLDTFRIRIKWDDMQVTDWLDNVQGVKEIDARHQLTDKAYGDLLGLGKDYVGMLDEEAETNAGGQPPQQPGQGGGPPGQGQGAGGPGAQGPQFGGMGGNTGTQGGGGGAGGK